MKMMHLCLVVSIVGFFNIGAMSEKDLHGDSIDKSHKPNYYPYRRASGSNQNQDPVVRVTTCMSNTVSKQQKSSKSVFHLSE